MMDVRKSNHGFTLIELMIVIAIIGILAAIAIPNFIAYRNKSFCSVAESDAETVAAAVADYFSIPANQTISVAALNGANAAGKTYLAATLTNQNPWNIGAANPTTVITIQVTDASARCPQDYQLAMAQANSPRSFWNAGVHTKLMAP